MFTYSGIVLLCDVPVVFFSNLDGLTIVENWNIPSVDRGGSLKYLMSYNDWIFKTNTGYFHRVLAHKGHNATALLNSLHSPRYVGAFILILIFLCVLFVTILLGSPNPQVFIFYSLLLLHRPFSTSRYCLSFFKISLTTFPLLLVLLPALVSQTDSTDTRHWQPLFLCPCVDKRETLAVCGGAGAHQPWLV